MDKKEIKEAISEAISEEFKKQPPPVSCFLGLDRDTHTKEHQFVNSLMKMSEKMDNMKLNFLSDTLKTVWRIFLVCAVVGALWLAKVELKKLSGLL